MFITDIFNVLIYEPLYNALIFLSGVMPGVSVGLAIIVLTIIVKIIILPLSHKSVKTQAAMKKIEPEIKKTKEKFKNDQQAQATEIMKLYKEHGVNPFSGCLLMLIQLPIILGLYWVFLRGLSNGALDPGILYSFVELPSNPNFEFLGFVDLRDKSPILAVLAGVMQFIQMHLAIPPIEKDKQQNKSNKRDFAEDLKKNLSTQAKYILPAIIIVISLSFPAAVPLYWFVSSGFSVLHELIVRRKSLNLLPKTQTPQG